MRSIIGKLGLGLALAAGACGANREDQPAVEERAAAVVNNGALNTFISGYLEVDQKVAGSLQADDANLFLGADPADGSPSFQVPAGPAGSTYVDWNDLGGSANALADHRLLDLDDPSLGKDASSFPQSNECVGPSQVLTKMDLTYVAAASNSTKAYFGVQRAGNTGDAGYYWLFNKLGPNLVVNQAPCSGGAARLTFNIRKGDVLLGGHFKPNGSPLLRVFKAKADQANPIPATTAIDFTNTAIWEEQAGALSAVAVNTTKTAPGTFGSAGVKNLVDNKTNLDTELFAEAGIDMSLFTGSASSCGATFWGTVITRSSGSGGTSPDLKDLAGPKLFNFGSASAQATLTAPTCGNTVTFAATGTGADGQAIANPTCTWTCNNGVTLSGCSGSQAFPVGTTSCSVTVGDPATTCVSDPASANAVTIYADVGAQAQLSADCAATVSYQGSGSGGKGQLSLSWTFSPDGAASSSASGSFTAASPGSAYTGTLTVTDERGCQATAVSNPATPYAPLVVHIAPDSAAPVCPMQSTAVTYSGQITGGSGNFSYGWAGHAECAGQTSCTIHPADSVLCHSESTSLTVTDAVCGSQVSETETYSKQTVVTATNN
jgi:hypothetical protein